MKLGIVVSPNEAALRRCRRAVIFPFLPTAGYFLSAPFFSASGGLLSFLGERK